MQSVQFRAEAFQKGPSGRPVKQDLSYFLLSWMAATPRMIKNGTIIQRDTKKAILENGIRAANNVNAPNRTVVTKLI